MGTIYATLDVEIQQIDGPAIADNTHILRWLTDNVHGEHRGIEFDACSTHDDPEECGCDCLDAAFTVTVVSAS